MRVFDAVGVLAVATWVVVVGLVVYERYGGAPATHGLSGAVVLEEGESWMSLQREEADVGYVHEVRTRLVDGWLLEYEMVMEMNVGAFTQVLQTGIKATLDDDAVLESFTGEIVAMGHTLRATGEVHRDGDGAEAGGQIAITVTAGASIHQRTVPFTEPPRLSANALNQVLASDALAPGAVIRQAFFDPTTMGMTEMTIEYVGPTEIELWDVTYAAHQFRQQVAGTSLQVVTDARGNVLIQRFPLDIIGSRVPDEVGRAQATAWRRNLRERDAAAAAPGRGAGHDAGVKLPGGLQGIPSVDDITKMLGPGMSGLLGVGGDSDAADDTPADGDSVAADDTPADDALRADDHPDFD